MEGVPEQFECALDRAEFRQLPGRNGIELYRAHIVKHVFEPHTHEAYGFGVIERGVERFRYKGGEHLAPPDSIVLMNPDILHTGRAETTEGWRYRMIYIDKQALAEVAGESGWYFSDAVIQGDSLRAKRLSHNLAALWQTQDALTFDGLLYQLISEVRPYGSKKPSGTDHSLHRFSPVLDYIHAHLEERLTLERLAAVAGLSPFHFLRQFQAQYHASPHQMVMAQRLYRAKQLLGTGMAPADVAASCGLTDQSHLTRAFVRRYGVTPGRYQQQVRR